MKKKASFGASCKERKYRIAKFAGMSSKVNWSALQTTSLTVNYQSAISLVLSDSDVLSEVVQTMNFGTGRKQFTAARIISLASDREPETMIPYLSDMLASMEQNRASEQAIRTILRIFLKLPIPESLESGLTNMCFDTIQNRNMPIACRAFAIQVAMKIVARHPEIANEILPFIQQIALFESGGLANSAQKFVDQLKKPKKTKRKPGA